MSTHLKGAGGAPGIALGRAVCYLPGQPAPDLADAGPQAALERFGAAQLNDRYRAATGHPMSGDVWLGWFAMKVLAESALRSRSVAAADLVGYLARGSFDGHKGSPLTFDSRRRLQQPLYELERASAGGAWSVRREIDPASARSGPR